MKSCFVVLRLLNPNLTHLSPFPTSPSPLPKDHSRFIHYLHCSARSQQTPETRCGPARRLITILFTLSLYSRLGLAIPRSEIFSSDLGVTPKKIPTGDGGVLCKCSSNLKGFLATPAERRLSPVSLIYVQFAAAAADTDISRRGHLSFSTVPIPFNGCSA